MVRSTTNGTLKSYRYNLQRSTYTLNKSRDTVLSQRKFNTFAENPADAARAFQLRRSFLRTESQHKLGESVVRKYDVAWSTLEAVVQDVDNRMNDSAYAAVIRGENDATASGRTALGQSLSSLAESIVQTMNCRYGDNFVFAGADGLDVPFTWEKVNGENVLHYRGISVNTAEPPDLQLDANGAPVTDAAGNYLALDGTAIAVADYEQNVKDWNALQYMANDEVKYADLGLGLDVNDNGEIIESSVANVALQGINYLGYGVDADGDPKNVVSIIHRMGEILENCSPESGEFASNLERDEFFRLAGKFEDAADFLSDKHTELDTQAAFLQGNQMQLETASYTLQEQIIGMEDVDLAEAITSFSWAQYCYNAALKVGNSILSESLMDYLAI